MLELRITCEGKTWAVPLAQGTRWRIGRGEACEIRVPDKRVSAEHAELLVAGDRLVVRRTLGQKPLEIDGKAVESAALASGSSFRIGHSQFTLVATRDGMDLIDARTILAGSWSEVISTDEASPERAAPERRILPTEPAATAQAPPLRLLAQLLALLTRAGDKTSLAHAVLELACQRLTATRALLARVEDAQRLEVVAARGLPLDADVKLLISTTVLKQIVDERQAVLIGNTAKSGTGLGRQKSIVRNHICAVACTPVFNTRGQLAGLLYVDNQDRPSEFSTQDGELLIWVGQVYNLLDENLEMRRRLEAEVSALKRSASSGAQMVAESPGMVLLLERARKAAASDAAVLIQGESGTGKECIARMLHQQSPRATRAFVARNCAAIPESLFESEMFGHKKGAFTGADHDRKGAFAEADGGTLFLDEIGDLNSSLQTKLLRAIQEKVIRPVGSDRDAPVNVRIVCASNKDLREGFKTRQFREDLFYRIATVTLTVPPLRQRREDIVALARHFIRQLSDATRHLTPGAEERLLAYAWPGNVRELRSVVEQAVIFAAGNEVLPDEIGLPVSGADRIDLSSQSLAEAERRHILQVLQSVNDNKSEAAKVLGLARSTLILKLHSYER